MLMQWRGVPGCGGALALWGLVVIVLWIWLVFPALPQACVAAETKHSANPGPLCVAPARPFRWRRSRAAQAPGATKPRSGFTLTAAHSSASHRCRACALARCYVCVLWVDAKYMVDAKHMAFSCCHGHSGEGRRVTAG